MLSSLRQRKGDRLGANGTGGFIKETKGHGRRSPEVRTFRLVFAVVPGETPLSFSFSRLS